MSNRIAREVTDLEAGTHTQHGVAWAPPAGAQIDPEYQWFRDCDVAAFSKRLNGGQLVTRTITVGQPELVNPQTEPVDQ